MNTGVESHYERKNYDKQCSKYGMLLIDLCKTANLVIVNGRMTNASSSNTSLRLEILALLIISYVVHCYLSTSTILLFMKIIQCSLTAIVL